MELLLWWFHLQITTKHTTSHNLPLTIFLFLLWRCFCLGQTLWRTLLLVPLLTPLLASWRHTLLRLTSESDSSHLESFSHLPREPMPEREEARHLDVGDLWSLILPRDIGRCAHSVALLRGSPCNLVMHVVGCLLLCWIQHGSLFWYPGLCHFCLSACWSDFGRLVTGTTFDFSPSFNNWYWNCVGGWDSPKVVEVPFLFLLVVFATAFSLVWSIGMQDVGKRLYKGGPEKGIFKKKFHAISVYGSFLLYLSRKAIDSWGCTLDTFWSA